MKCLVCLLQFKRQVVIDMRIHPSEGKLNTINSRATSRFKQRCPRTRDRAWARQVPDCPEIQVCKDHIQSSDPFRMPPAACGRVNEDFPGQQQVKETEPPQ